MVTALGRFGEVELLVVLGVPGHSRLLRRLKQVVSALRGRSALEGTVDVARMRRQVATAAAEAPGRPIFLNHLRSACFLAYMEEALPAPVVYVAQNCEAEAARSVANLTKNPIRRWILTREAGRIEDLESRVASRASHVVTLTDEDAARFTCPTTVIPPLMEAASIPPAAPKRSGEGATLCLISSFNWAPKRWNAYWAVRKVMPLLWARYPEVRLVVVGSGARRLRIRHPGVSIESDVADIRPYYELADVVIVPERQRSGLKFKTVQAALAGKAIVSTPEGVEGTGLGYGESAIVRSSADAFADGISGLMADPDRRARLGGRARAVATERFSERRILALLSGFLEQLETAEGGGDRPPRDEPVALEVARPV
jgi:hypothetical protein